MLKENIMTKAEEWTIFAFKVKDHIKNYCVVQYGENPDKMIEGFSIIDIKKQLERYAKRIGVNIRGVEEAKRDALKIAHYACILLAKIEKDSDRDYYMSAEEAKKYGIIDKIVK